MHILNRMLMLIPDLPFKINKNRYVLIAKAVIEVFLVFDRLKRQIGFLNHNSALNRKFIIIS